MAAKYTRFRTVYEVSETSDYAKSDQAETEDTATTPTQAIIKHRFKAAVAGSAYSLAHLATCPRFLIKNRDGTNFVTITYQTNSGAATTQTMKIGAGKTAVLLDLRAIATVVQNPTITADTAACDCEISYEGT